MFPYLRMAHLVHTGMICTELGIQAAKVPFGGAQLVSAAFGIKMGEESAEQYASYVLSGSFNTDLGALIQQDLRIFNAILSFRNSSEGLAFRRAVSSVLTVPSGENSPRQLMQDWRGTYRSLYCRRRRIGSHSC